MKEVHAMGSSTRSYGTTTARTLAFSALSLEGVRDVKRSLPLTGKYFLMQRREAAPGSSLEPVIPGRPQAAVYVLKDIVVNLRPEIEADQDVSRARALQHHLPSRIDSLQVAGAQIDMCEEAARTGSTDAIQQT